MSSIFEGRRSGTIKAAIEYSGISRSRLYTIAAENPGLFRKISQSVLVDFHVLDQLISNLPAAVIKPAPSRVARAEAARAAKVQASSPEA